MAITAIRVISNFVSGSSYVISNREHPSDTGGKAGLRADANQRVQCNMWIPWCNSQSDFEWNHKIIIVPFAENQLPKIFAIWQQGDYIRHSSDGVFHANGDLVPGNCTVGGDRAVEILGTSIFNAGLRFF